MTVYLQDPDVTLLHGDALEQLRTLPDESVHCCVTSPPFYGLRDYGTGRWVGGNSDCDHLDPDWQQRVKNSPKQQTNDGSYARQELRTCRKCGAQRVDQQIGLEATPEQWVASLVAVFREVKRVLRRDGTLWLEIGDSYNSLASNQKGKAGSGMNERPKYLERGQADRDGRQTRLVPGLKPKDLIGAPWMLAFALRADGWYLRSEIIWSKPNPMPESCGDRPTTAHSRIFLLAKQPRYFFDQEAVREPHVPRELGGLGRLGVCRDDTERVKTWGGSDGRGLHQHNDYNPAGRNVRSVWNIATQPYPEAHFATFPEELARRCILAGTSEWGCCPECGAPWVREIDSTAYAPPTVAPGVRFVDESRMDKTRKLDGKSAAWRAASESRQTLGWMSTCNCPPGDRAHGETAVGAGLKGNSPAAGPIPCTVLDPFMGSGTVAHVARKHGRRSIGIDLNAAYLDLAAKRLSQLSLLATTEATSSAT